jgi:hypothetical protein
MGIYIRKSFGRRLRVNVSKGGIGLSAGVKGLRVGVNPRGRGYVAGGRKGIYFRQSLRGGSGSSGILGVAGLLFVGWFCWKVLAAFVWGLLGGLGG